MLYLQDGQNLFGSQKPGFPPHQWRADISEDALVKAGLIAPVIIVGIDNAGAARADEYLPTRAATSRGAVFGGLGDLYVRMLIEEIKPLIDRRFQTDRSADGTGIGGSSLGAIISIYAAIKHPEVFHRVACFSPSVWWDHRWIVGEIETLKTRPRLKIWVDIGTDEDDDAEPDANAFTNALISKGWKMGKDMAYMVEPGAHHEELAWAHRFPLALEFLFPARR